MKDAVDWHSQIATDFDKKYLTSSSFRERYDLWEKLIEQYSKSDSRVLDVGCGSGVFSFLAAAWSLEVVGIEGSKEMLDLCRRNMSGKGINNLQLLNSRLEGFDYTSLGRFDFIICSSILEYIEDFWGTLNDLQNLLVPGGILIFSIPNASSLYRRFEKLLFALTGRPRYYAYVRHLMKQKDLSESVETNGLEILETHFYAATPILSTICRFLGKPALGDNLILLVCRQPQL